MAFVDARTPAMRALVYEYGYEIVLGMWLDGHRNAGKLRVELEAWRERKQAQWLSAIPYRRVHSVNTQP